jgi:hypothetical protein
MDEKSLHVMLVDITADFDCLTEAIQGVTVHFMENINEMRHQE